MNFGELVEVAAEAAEARWAEWSVRYGRRLGEPHSAKAAHADGFASGVALGMRMAADSVKHRETTTSDHTVKHTDGRETFRK